MPEDPVYEATLAKVRDVSRQLRALSRELEEQAEAAVGHIREQPQEDLVTLARRLLLMSERLGAQITRF